MEQQSICLDVEVSQDEFVRMSVDVSYETIPQQSDVGMSGDEVELINVVAPDEYKDNAFVTQQLNSDQWTEDSIKEAIYNGL